MYWRYIKNFRCFNARKYVYWKISRAGKGVVRAGRCYDMDYIGKSV